MADIPIDTPVAPDASKSKGENVKNPRGPNEPGKTRAAEPQNSIELARRRQRTAPEPDATRVPDAARAQADPSAAAKNTRSIDQTVTSDAVPAEVRDRFTRLGKQYRFADGALAFTDRGTKLVTPSENTEVIRSLALIAQARGWEAVTVRGSEAFRREAWTRATEMGLQVRGYAPSEVEQVRLAQRMARGRGAAATQESARAAGDELASPVTASKQGQPSREGEATAKPGSPDIVGKLLEHGRAPYQHTAGEPPSYFVKLQTERGERTVWGVDLERAFRESSSRPQVGGAVTLRSLRRETVTIKTLDKGPGGEETPRDLAVHRNRWQVESSSFLEGRAKAAELLRNPDIMPSQAVKQNPELTHAYLHLRGAELLAKDRIKHPGSRQNFLSLVRNSLADHVGRGEKVPPAMLRTDRTREPPRPDREPPLTR